METIQLDKNFFTVKEYYQLTKVGILKPTERVEVINGKIIKTSYIQALMIEL